MCGLNGFFASFRLFKLVVLDRIEAYLLVIFYKLYTKNQLLSKILKID